MSRAITQERLEGRYHELAVRDFNSRLYDDQQQKLGMFMRDWLVAPKRFGFCATRAELVKGWRDIHQTYLHSLRKMQTREDFQALEAVIHSNADLKRLAAIQARRDGELGFAHGLLPSEPERLQSLVDLVLTRDRRLVFRQFIGRTSWKGFDDHTDRLKMGVLRTIEEADNPQRR